jgi:hypothetical protein
MAEWWYARPTRSWYIRSFLCWSPTETGGGALALAQNAIVGNTGILRTFANLEKLVGRAEYSIRGVVDPSQLVRDLRERIDHEKEYRVVLQSPVGRWITSKSFTFLYVTTFYGESIAPLLRRLPVPCTGEEFLSLFFEWALKVANDIGKA